MKEAELIRCYYRSVGANLMVDAMVVDFEVDGEVYEHQLVNMGWSYQTQALAFLAYADMKPSDADGQIFDLSGKTAPVAWDNGEEQYMLTNRVILAGQSKLEGADWFNPKGEVWNSEQHAIGHGISSDPGGGSTAEVDISEG